jgi:hypothetical protein
MIDPRHEHRVVGFVDADEDAVVCEGLEPAAVWDATHVAERLRDHYAGQPNVYLERMRLQLP